MVGIALLTPEGVAGAATYLLGHGLAAAALFMGAGILLARCAAIDEFALLGQGGRLRSTGCVFALGALCLAGGLPGAMQLGRSMVDAATRTAGFAWLGPLLLAASVVTGAAVLRATARIFLGWGARGGEEEEEAPTESEREPSDRPVWLMLLPAGILLAASIGLGCLPQLEPGLSRAARLLTQQSAYASAVLEGSGVSPAAPPVPAAGVLERVVPSLAALGLAALALWRDRLGPLPSGAAGRRLHVLLRPLRAAHSGRVGDYVAWLVFGLAVLGVAVAVAAGP
jgi:multicomponent Na+:H+ antiporter subunit D